jgi:AcrR family transcriptional regulator
VTGVAAKTELAKRSGRSGKRQLRHADVPPPDLSRNRHYGLRHQELLDGIEKIILTEGFCDLTIGELAERLQCSRRTLYEIAESKEQIVLVVVDRLFRRLAWRAREAVRAEVTRLDQLYTYLTYGLVDLRQATLNFAEDVAGAPAVHELMAAHFRYAVGQVETMLADGIEAGKFAPLHPTLAAEILDAGIARLLDSEVLRSAGVSLSDGLEEFFNLFVDGLRLP